MLKRINTIQTRDCYYPVYHCEVESNPNYPVGYYFYDDEFEEAPNNPDWCWNGPYPTLDIVCKEQYKYWEAIQSL